jgi:5-methyltetrahydropteroyltriglutamate--homocysteine methyltransferase
MRVIAANHSSLPPPDDAPLSADIGALTRHAVRAQVEAGLDVVTDGQLDWAHGPAHVLDRVDGVRLNPKNRGRPIIQGKLRHRTALLADEYRRAQEAAPVAVKPVVPGPYSLAHLCDIATTAYDGATDLAADLAILLAEEIRGLVGAGARTIQVDEPRILHCPGDIRLLRELLEPLAIAAGEAELAVATYSADATPLYAQLSSLPSQVLALDCSQQRGLVEVIASTGCGKILALGLVDGGHESIESADDLLRSLERALHRYAHDRVIIQPSCGLAALPWNVARRKLERLVEARERFAAR